tara:strand:- start:3098 stop:3244 length:147 start_codon:yes stop_codon:yes gene_type:complete
MQPNGKEDEKYNERYPSHGAGRANPKAISLGSKPASHAPKAAKVILAE